MFFLIFIILVFALYQLKSLFLSSWYVSHDGIFHLIRAQEFFYALKLGYFPVRWAFHLDNNFGLPLFNFIYPGPYYLSVLLQFFGFSEWSGIKALIISSYFLGGLGIFLIFKKRHKYLALVSALLYLLVPYHFLNIFVRAALGEILAIGIMPWTWLAFQNLVNKTKLRWYHPLPLFLLFLFHNFLSIFFLIFLLVYLVINKKLRKETISSLLFSFGLAAFFLIPMIGESRYLTSIVNQQASYDYQSKAVSLKSLIYSKWGFGFSAIKSEEQMSFQLGISNILVVILGLIISLIKPKKELLIYLVTFMAAVFLITPQSGFLLSFFPWLSFAHFPYRFLFLTTFLTPLIAFEVFEYCYQKNIKPSFLLIFFLLSLALYNTRHYKRPMLSLNQDQIKQELIINQHTTTTTNRREILPQWVKGTRRFGSEIKLSSDQLIVDVQSDKTFEYVLRINNQSNQNGHLFIPQNYFPSWQVKIDGKKKKEFLFPSEDGWLKLEVLPGIHNYRVYLGETFLEKLANLISLLTLVILTRTEAKYLIMATRKRYKKGKRGSK